MFTTVSLHAALGAMEARGGSFVRSLAEARWRADKANGAKLDQAFADLFESYGAKRVVLVKPAAPINGEKS